MQLDVLVRSGSDAGEDVDPATLDPPPRTVVTTLGGDGGRWDGEAGSGTWEPQALPGPRDGVQLRRAALGADRLMIGAAELAFADLLADPARSS